MMIGSGVIVMMIGSGVIVMMIGSGVIVMMIGSGYLVNKQIDTTMFKTFMLFGLYIRDHLMK